jgi:hypothetical protein
MTSVHPRPGPVDPRPASDPLPASLMDRIRYLEWGPVIAGAIAAAALALVLHAFALAIGLSVSSTAPTWRDASFALVLARAHEAGQVAAEPVRRERRQDHIQSRQCRQRV